MKIKADLFRGTGRRDKGSEVPTLPRNCVIEKSKCKNRMHKTQTLWSRMVEFYAWKKIGLITKSGIQQWNRTAKVS